MPLVVALLAIRFDHAERAHGSRLVGLVVGFAGVVVLLGLDVAGRPGELLGAGAILLAAVGYAAGPMIIKQRLSDLDPLGPVTASMGISMVLLAPFALGTWPEESPGGDAIASVLVLGVVCSAIAFLAFFALIAEAGPGKATIITYVNPVVAVTLGVILLDESVGPSAVAGLLLILAGSWLSTGGKLPPGLAARRRGVAAAGHGAREWTRASMEDGLDATGGDRGSRRGAAGAPRGPAAAMPDGAPRRCGCARLRPAAVGVRWPGVAEDYRELREQPWAARLIARSSLIRFWADWPVLQPTPVPLEDPANPVPGTSPRSTGRSTPPAPTGST